MFHKNCELTKFTFNFRLTFQQSSLNSAGLPWECWLPTSSKGRLCSQAQCPLHFPSPAQLRSQAFAFSFTTPVLGRRYISSPHSKAPPCAKASVRIKREQNSCSYHTGLLYPGGKAGVCCQPSEFGVSFTETVCHCAVLGHQSIGLILSFFQRARFQQLGCGCIEQFILFVGVFRALLQCTGSD